MSQLTAERLRELLEYSKETGEFMWLISNRRIAAGMLAGSIDGRGYHCIGIEQVVYTAHRLAWLYVTGTFPSSDIDHINRVRHDNRWENLREVSRSVNTYNSGKRIDNTSGVRGVCYSKRHRKWLARASNAMLYNGTDYFEAICARKSWEQQYGS